MASGTKLNELMDVIDAATTPDKMSRSEAVELQMMLMDRLQSNIEALETEIAGED